MTSTSFDSSNFVTNMPVENVQITYDSAKAIITLEGSYLEAIEGRTFTLSITYTNDLTFNADPSSISYTAVGINAQLTIDSQSSLNSFLPSLVMI